MAVATAVTKAILSYRDVEAQFDLERSSDPAFFPEWQSAALPQLLAAESHTLNRLQQRYLRYLEAGEVSEGTLNLIMLAPLLDGLGLCDPPYSVKGETWVRVQTETEDESGRLVLEGRIDALTILDRLWLAVIEVKRGGFNVIQAVPQLLTYMMGTPRGETPEDGRPVFGLATNGYDFLFVKLVREPERRYGISHNFTLLSDEQHDLRQVGRV
ncbi:MAG: type I restriction endonuclease subunit R [Synechococcales cyanobacterium RU_4_20]|nr:type I restriction endonuclease subunit R [Synechococcales cyanobacterium RU_4_20]